MPHDHDEGHDHGGSELSALEVRVRALESLLVEKGYVDPAALDVLIETYETKVVRTTGVASRRPGTRSTATGSHRRDRRGRSPATTAGSMVALANGDGVHNLVVCTLCSCYPWPVLGLPPVWYKSAPYRSRAVIDPRGVLDEFGVRLPDDVEIRVWDSTAEVRYLVLPERPPGTDGWTEAELATLVTRDSMIGTGLWRPRHNVRGPAAGAHAGARSGWRAAERRTAHHATGAASALTVRWEHASTEPRPVAPRARGPPWAYPASTHEIRLESGRRTERSP
jgi:nitrile hydratase